MPREYMTEMLRLGKPKMLERGLIYIAAFGKLSTDTKK